MASCFNLLISHFEKHVMNTFPFFAAEEYQKFAYPTSEFVLKGLLSSEHGGVWAPFPRIVEFIFDCGLNAWTREMAEMFQKLCWRFCIMVEETYGTTECLITLHSLVHLPDDIQRFSSPDNFWCFQFFASS